MPHKNLKVRRTQSEMGGLYAVMLPFLAQGHMIPLLQLSRMLAIKGVTVIYVSTPFNLRQIRSRDEAWDALVHFQELPMPASPLPPGCENTSQVPREMIPFIFEAIEKLEDPFDALMDGLTERGSGYYRGRGLPLPDRLILVHDVGMGWAEAVAAKFRVPSFTFVGLSACNWLCMRAKYWQEEPLHELREILKGGQPEAIGRVIGRQMEGNRRTTGILINTFWEMESKFLQRLREAEKSDGKPLWAVGPLNLLADADQEEDGRNSGHRFVEWLDGQRRASVVYIAFGSETPLSVEQTRELGVGLEASGQPFLWAIKAPPDCPSADWKSQVFPADFEARLNGRGLLECGWVPQTVILSHESTGAYLTHCGWNSVCEGVMAGVPMIAWPLLPYLQAAAVILTREVHVAVEMGNTLERRDQLVRSEEVQRAIRRVMLEEEGVHVRRRMKALSEAALAAIARDRGPAWKALDSFLEFVNRQ